MKTKMNWRSVVSISLIALVMVACNQENSSLSPQDEIMADDDNQMIVEETEAIFSYNEDLFGGFSNLRESAETGTDSAGMSHMGKRPLKNDKCATITRGEANGVITVVVDYGTVKECEGKKVGGNCQNSEGGSNKIPDRKINPALNCLVTVCLSSSVNLALPFSSRRMTLSGILCVQCSSPKCLVARPLAYMSSMFSACVPSNRWSGRTHLVLSQ